jgi:uracil phosphoribosyltransferase
MRATTVYAMRLQVVDHPLISHKLTTLRDQDTASPDFRRLTEELVTLLAYEATRDVRVDPVSIVTPVGPAEGVNLSRPRPLVVPILRAGLGMADGLLELVPSARLGHIGLYRDHETKRPVEYFVKLPDPEGRTFILVDPMLATGHSSAAAADTLNKRGVSDDNIRMMVLVAAPEGVRVFQKAHPKIPVYTAALDSHLNENAYIVPGLGDAGDRLFGTK